jgi:hypothetical protein
MLEAEMIAEEKVEEMYLEQHELHMRIMKEQLISFERDKFRLLLNILEVGSLLAIAIFLWSM